MPLQPRPFNFFTPFFGGNLSTPQDIARARRDALIAQRAAGSGNIGAAIGGGIRSLILNSRANAAEQRGIESVREAGRGLLGTLPGTASRRGLASREATNIPEGLIESESGGNFGAQNSVPGAGGRGHFGRLQFSRARLNEASKALGETITPQRFLDEPDLQRRVEQWHFSDIDNFAQSSGVADRFGEVIGGVPLTADSFRAMAHLGGKGGAKRFVDTGGRHNPSDAFGTSLRDYGQRFAGVLDGAVPVAADVPVPVARPESALPVASVGATLTPADVATLGASQPGDIVQGGQVVPQPVPIPSSIGPIGPDRAPAALPTQITAASPAAVQPAQPSTVTVTPTAGPAPLVQRSPQPSAIPARLRSLRGFDEDFTGIDSVPNAFRNVVAQPQQPARSLAAPLTGAAPAPLPGSGVIARTPNAPVQGAIAAAPSANAQVAAAMDILSNPFSPPGLRRVASGIVNRAFTPPDPRQQAQLEGQQLRNEQLRRQLQQPAEREMRKDANGRLRFVDDGSFVFPEFTPEPGKPDIITLAPVRGGPAVAIDVSTNEGAQRARALVDAGTHIPAKSSTSLTVGPDGTVSFQQGAGAKPLTEGQSKDVVFATRAEGALPVLNANELALTGVADNILSALPGGNLAVSEEFQSAAQAGREFLQAILRKDTGAAITEAEVEEYGTVYLPRPGDTQATIAQKRASRDRAIAALKAGMPSNAILAQEKALQRQQPPTADEIRKELRRRGQ